MKTEIAQLPHIEPPPVEMILPQLGVMGSRVIIGHAHLEVAEARAFAKRIGQFAKLAEGKNVRSA